MNNIDSIKVRVRDRLLTLQCQPPSAEENPPRKGLIFPIADMLVEELAINNGLGDYVLRSGDIMTGGLKIDTDEDTPFEISNESTPLFKIDQNAIYANEIFEGGVTLYDKYAGKNHTHVDITALITAEAATRINADNNLQSQIDALFGAVIFVGTIALNTPDVTQDALNARAAELGKTPLRKGYCLIDSGANDWWYDGGAWVNIGYYQVAQATNTNLGVVKGSAANLKISVDGLGEMSVNGLQTALDGKATSAQGTKADSALQILTANNGLTVDAKSGTTQNVKGVDATTSVKGVVQLNDNTNSTSTAQAATANAVKKAYDLASGKQAALTATGNTNVLVAPASAGGQPTTKPISDFATSAQGTKADSALQSVTASNGLTVDAKSGTTQNVKGVDATTSVKGVVQLNDNTNSTSTAQAATANAVKKAYDLASGKQAALNRTVGGNDNATGTVNDTGGNLSVPIQVTTVAPTASATIQAAGTRSLRSSVQGLINNVQELLNRADTSGSGSFLRKTGDTVTGSNMLSFNSTAYGIQYYTSPMTGLHLSGGTSGIFQVVGSKHMFCGLVEANNGLRLTSGDLNASSSNIYGSKFYKGTDELPFNVTGTYDYTNGSSAGVVAVGKLVIEKGLVTTVGSTTITPTAIGAATKDHNHNASNINAGTLPVARGGTGATSVASAPWLQKNGNSSLVSGANLFFSASPYRNTRIGDQMITINGSAADNVSMLLFRNEIMFYAVTNAAWNQEAAGFRFQYDPGSNRLYLYKRTATAGWSAATWNSAGYFS